MYLSHTELIAFLLTTLAVMATPGVTVSSIVGTTLHAGLGAGLAMEAGVNIARVSMMALLAIGLEAVGQFVSMAYDWIKLAGALYLIWLGFKALRSKSLFRPASGTVGSLPRQMVSGFIVLWGNPKAFIFFGAFIPHFIHQDMPVAPQAAFLALIWVCVATFTDSCYILLAATARHNASSSTLPIIGRLSGLVLVGAGVWLALSRKA